jgi:hypothetical protein
MMESERQLVVAEDVCCNRLRWEKNDSPNEAPTTVNEDSPVVSANTGFHAAMTGAEYDAKTDELPTLPAVTNTGRTVPTPETSMADMHDSDTHFDVWTDDAEMRTAGLGWRVAKSRPMTGINWDPEAGGLKRVFTTTGWL